MNANTPWYKRTGWIGGLLVLFPPLGIALTWMFAPWSRNKKSILTVVSAGLGLFYLHVRNNDPGERRPGIASAASPRPIRTPRPLPPATPAVPTPLPAPSPALAAPVQRDAPKSASYDPRLLLPLRLRNLPLSTVKQPEAGLSEARYESAKAGKFSLLLAVSPSSNNNFAAEWTAATVAQHEGRITPNYGPGGLVMVAWVSGPWLFRIDLEPTGSFKGRDEALRAAAEAAAWADRHISAAEPIPEAVAAEHIKKLDDINAATAARAYEERFKQFAGAIEKAGAGVVTNIRSDPRDPDTVVLTVATGWHYEPKVMRLQGAQTLWRVWSRINSPADPDRSRLQLVDGNGNEVGGSRAVGGSMLWVQD